MFVFLETMEHAMNKIRITALAALAGLAVVGSNVYAQAGGPGGTTTTSPSDTTKADKTGRTPKSTTNSDSTMTSPSSSERSTTTGTPDASKPSTNNDANTGTGSTGSSTKDKKKKKDKDMPSS